MLSYDGMKKITDLLQYATKGQLLRILGKIEKLLEEGEERGN